MIAQDERLEFAVPITHGGRMFRRMGAVGGVAFLARPEEVPVTVTVVDPGVALLLAVRVRILAPLTGSVINAAVTPVGMPVAARLMAPLNEAAWAMPTVSVALKPGDRDREIADGKRRKLAPGVGTVRGAVASKLPDVTMEKSLDGAPAAVIVADFRVTGPLNVRVRGIGLLLEPMAVAGRVAFPSVYFQRSV